MKKLMSINKAIANAFLSVSISNEEEEEEEERRGK